LQALTPALFLTKNMGLSIEGKTHTMKASLYRIRHSEDCRQSLAEQAQDAARAFSVFDQVKMTCSEHNCTQSYTAESVVKGSRGVVRGSGEGRCVQVKKLIDKAYNFTPKSGL